MKALIDADIFQHEYGNATDDEYKPLSWPLIQARVQSRIDGILEATGADGYQLYLTSDDKSNFRYSVATIQPYKGHRPSEKPHWYTHIRNFLVDFRGAIEVFGQEADDALAIAQYQDYCESFNRMGYDVRELKKDPLEVFYDREHCNTVICSRDKDLNMVPGWHYNWGAGKQKEQGMWFQTEIGGLRCFYKQLLTGDRTDNIPGLYGVGNSSKLLKDLELLNSEEDLFRFVFEQYEKRFGSYAEQFIVENGRLLWMRREEGEMWVFPKQLGDKNAH